MGRRSFTLLGAISILVLIGNAKASGQERIVGYYASWKSSALPYDQVEYSNLTHIIVAFATPDSDGTLSYDTGIPFAQLVDSAHANGVKVLLSIGGYGGGTYFPNVTADSSSRGVFIDNIVSFLSTNHYDGVDIDWETPSTSGQTNSLTALVREMRSRFDEVDSSWLITIAAPAGNYGGQHFDYQGLTPYVSWYNLMCYDFVGSWCSYSGHNSPLYESRTDPNAAGADSNSIAYMHHTRGVPLDKIVLGVPFYAVSFNVSGLYMKLTDKTTSNPGYPEIMSDTGGDWKYNWDDVSKVPYLTNASLGKFITFEDTASIRLKAEFATRNKLGGMMIWELSQDMYEGSQPLLEALASALRTPTGVISSRPVVAGYKLYDNYPNPFNPSTLIGYSLAAPRHVLLAVYDVLGRKVAVLVDGRVGAGRHEVSFDGTRLSSGVYFYTLKAGSFFETKKMILLK